MFFVLLLLHSVIVPYQPLHSTGAPFRDAVAKALKITWRLWAAWFLALSSISLALTGRVIESSLTEERKARLWR